MACTLNFPTLHIENALAGLGRLAAYKEFLPHQCIIHHLKSIIWDLEGENRGEFQHSVSKIDSLWFDADRP